MDVNTIEFRKARGRDVQYVDTRSPGEFEIDHIPGAINLPIFNDEERAIVGTIYTRESHEKAYEKGREFYEKKIESIKKSLKQIEKPKVIYCWRGGMRSKVITTLGAEIGLDCMQFVGGYKKYREYIREHLYNYKLKPKLIVIHGLTGSGKTDVIEKLSEAIDLEGLAQHRSSAFGAIGLNPASQKMFETNLFYTLEELKNRKFIVIEGESRKIGNIIMPEFLFKAMKKGIIVKASCTFENRVKRLNSIYTNNKKNIEKTKEIILSLQKKIGKKRSSEMLDALEKEDIPEFMKLILKHYYDPLYKFSIDKLEAEFEINTDSISAAIEQLKAEYSVQ